MIHPIFLSHGAPTRAINNGEYELFLSNYAKNKKPKGIIIFSAHWESKSIEITHTDETLKTIHDYYGFPDYMYEIEYPAKGSKELSNKVNDLFKSSDIETTLNSSRGLDHGSWTLLIHMFDSNEMPVVQISINPFLSVKEQINIGSVLKSLSENDYLIIGSGAVFHNFKYLTNSNEPLKEAVEFDQWLVDVVTNEDTDALENYQDNPLTKYAMERPEHFVPLLILYGARVGKPRVIHQSFEFGSLSNLSFEF